MNGIQTDESKGKSQERRKQVLDAAAECFRKEGFHGCSIVKISKASNMSPGHIYYHFKNKEDIVEALVKQQESTLLQIINDIKSSPIDEEFVSILVRHTAESIERHTSPAFIGLWLEISAESARNPRVAELLKQSHKVIAEQFEKQLRLRRHLENEIDVVRLKASLEILYAIFMGLSANTPQQSNKDKIDKVVLTEIINGIIKHLFGQPNEY